VVRGTPRSAELLRRVRGLAHTANLSAQALALPFARVIKLPQHADELAAARAAGAKPLALSVLTLCVSHRETSPLLAQE